MNDNKDVLKLWRENIDSVLSKQSPERRVQDQKRIEKIRDMMCVSPLGKEILGWADENDIVILMDNETDASGYYFHGLKTIGLNTYEKDINLVGTLAHEIRHAWQDSLDLIPIFSENTDKKLWSKFQEYMLQVRFYEADAYAIGQIVKKSVFFTTEEKAIEALPLFEKAYRRMQMNIVFKKDSDFKEDAEYILKEFEDFFKKDSRRNLYDKRVLKIYSKELGIKGIEIPLSGNEYDTKEGDENDIVFNVSYSKGLNVHDEQSVRKLGDIFGKYNYMESLKYRFHKDIKFCGNVYFSSVKAMDIAKHKSSEHALFKQVKNLQKKCGIR